MFMSTVSSENEEEDYEWTPPVSDQKLVNIACLIYLYYNFLSFF